MTQVLVILGLVTPLLYVLATIIGVGVGVLFVSMVRDADEKTKAEHVAKIAARRAVDETLRGISPDGRERE